MIGTSKRNVTGDRTDRRKAAELLAPLLYILSFLLPVAIMLAVSAKQGFYPFGDKSMLIMDMRDQYVEFFASLRYLARGDASVLYSWSCSMGGSYLGLFAYYVASPLSFLTVFFPLEQLPLAIWLLTLLKIGLCGLTFQWYARYLWRREEKAFQEGKPWLAQTVLLLIAVSYALISYNMVYSLSLMWLDGVILLPVICLGVEKLLDGKKGIHYMLAIALLFISNYYIGYMAGIFTALYFLFRILCHWEKGCFKQMLLRTGHFALCTGFAFGLSAPLILPLVKEFLSGKMNGQNYLPDTRTNFALADLWKKFGNGVYDSITNSGLPAIYCGLLPLLLAVLFLILPRIPWKEKLGAVLLALLLLYSFYNTKLDIAWHAFRYPNWFPYRYAFLFSFMILYMACRSLTAMSWKWWRKGCLAAVAVILCFVCLDLKKNGDGLIAGLDQEFGYRSMEEYQAFLDKAYPMVKSIQEKDGGFYRMNQSFEFSKNDSMLLGYHGMTHYSSIHNQAVNDFSRKLGIAQAWYWNSGYGSTPLTDSLFSVKYLLEDSPVPSCYQPLDSGNGASAYQNPLCLPIAYSGRIAAQPELAEGDPFANQNLWIQSLTGIQAPCFTPLEYSRQDTERGWSYSFVPTEGQPVYLYMRADSLGWADVYVNGNWMGNYFSNETNCNLYLGTFGQGETVTVECVPTEAKNVTGVYLYQLNMDHLNQAMDILADGGMEITSHRAAKLEGRINVGEGEGVMTSIPYDAGWKLLVDGREVKTRAYAGVWLAADVSPGEHQICLRYQAPGFRSGILAWVIAVFLAALYLGGWKFLRNIRLRKGIQSK